MSRHQVPLLATAVLLAACSVLALQLPAQEGGSSGAKRSNPASTSSTPNSSPDNSAQPAEKMTSQTKIMVIRSLTAEKAFAKHLFPMGTKGLTIKNGKVSPGDNQLQQLIAENGMAAQPGDRVTITRVDVHEKSISFEINGGPKKHDKWYQHVQVGMNGAGSTLGPPNTTAMAHGSVVTLEFDGYVPEITGDQIRDMLAPVIDFKALTVAEAYEKTLSPKLQEAIKNHTVLVGMDRDLVIYAKGRPDQKIRDKDETGKPYEEWIYGTPPAEVDFVRFTGDIVTRLEIMTVDGDKIVKTQPEIDLATDKIEVAEKKAPPKPTYAPTLRRPGEDQDGSSPDGGLRSDTADKHPVDAPPDKPTLSEDPDTTPDQGPPTLTRPQHQPEPVNIPANGPTAPDQNMPAGNGPQQ